MVNWDLHINRTSTWRKKNKIKRFFVSLKRDLQLFRCKCNFSLDIYWFKEKQNKNEEQNIYPRFSFGLCWVTQRGNRCGYLGGNSARSHCTLHTAHCTYNTPHYTLQTAHWILHTEHCTQCSLHTAYTSCWSLIMVHYTVENVQFALHTAYTSCFKH